MTRTVHFLIVYNELSQTCCISSQQANTVRQRRCQNAPKPGGGLATGAPCHGTIGTMVNPPVSVHIGYGAARFHSTPRGIALCCVTLRCERGFKACSQHMN